MVFIYVLQLEQNKFYVGMTNNPSFRINTHFSFDGSEWTKLYKPLQVLELVPNCDEFDEDKYTLKYMKKYGIDNVRGGAFVQIQLDNSSVEVLKRMINVSSNKCFGCGQLGHFIKECPNKKSDIPTTIQNIEVKKNDKSENDDVLNAIYPYNISMKCYVGHTELNLDTILPFKQINNTYTWGPVRIPPQIDSRIEIMTSKPLKNEMYVSIYDFIVWIIKILKITDTNVNEQIFQAAHAKELQPYYNGTNIKNKFDAYLLQCFINIIENDLHLGKITYGCSYFEYNTNSKAHDQDSQYIICNDRWKHTVIIIKLFLSQKPYVFRGIFV